MEPEPPTRAALPSPSEVQRTGCRRRGSARIAYRVPTRYSAITDDHGRTAAGIPDNGDPCSSKVLVRTDRNGFLIIRLASDVNSSSKRDVHVAFRSRITNVMDGLQALTGVLCKGRCIALARGIRPNVPAQPAEIALDTARRLGKGTISGTRSHCWRRSLGARKAADTATVADADMSGEGSLRQGDRHGRRW